MPLVCGIDRSNKWTDQYKYADKGKKVAFGIGRLQCQFVFLLPKS